MRVSILVVAPLCGLSAAGPKRHCIRDFNHPDYGWYTTTPGDIWDDISDDFGAYVHIDGAEIARINKYQPLSPVPMGVALYVPCRRSCRLTNEPDMKTLGLGWYTIVEHDTWESLERDFQDLYVHIQHRNGFKVTDHPQHTTPQPPGKFIKVNCPSPDT